MLAINILTFVELNVKLALFMHEVKQIGLACCIRSIVLPCTRSVQSNAYIAWFMSAQ